MEALRVTLTRRSRLVILPRAARMSGGPRGCGGREPKLAAMAHLCPEIYAESALAKAARVLA